MRQLLTLIVLAAIGFGGWQAWQKHPEYFAVLLPKEKKVATKPVVVAQQTKPATPVEEATAPLTQDSSGQPILAAVTTPEKVAEPEPAPEVKPKLPPGQFLMTERVSAETRDGVIAVVRGDIVKLLERRRDGTLKVTNGKADFVVRPHQVTQDLMPSPQSADKGGHPATIQ